MLHKVLFSVCNRSVEYSIAAAEHVSTTCNRPVENSIAAVLCQRLATGLLKKALCCSSVTTAIVTDLLTSSCGPVRTDMQVQGERRHPDIGLLSTSCNRPAAHQFRIGCVASALKRGENILKFNVPGGEYLSLGYLLRTWPPDMRLICSVRFPQKWELCIYYVPTGYSLLLSCLAGIATKGNVNYLL
jgi:hypothetical protein